MHRSRPVRQLLAALGFAALAAAADATPVEVRMATLVPEGGAVMKILGQSAAEIGTRTGNRVRIKYYAGGVQGDERDIVRKINLGQLDGAVLTSVGLSMIEDSIRVLELPRLFASVQELDYVADKMWPHFQKQFEAKGFRLEERGEVGWVHFVSKDEVRSLDTLKSLKVWLGSDDAIVRALYKQLGVSGVPLGIPEVEPALTTGRINAAYGSPLTAVELQWSPKVTFMTSMPMFLAVGGTVTKLEALKKISRDDQQLMAKVAHTSAKSLREWVRKDNERAKAQMQAKGLKITEATADMRAGIDRAAAAVWKELTGKTFSKAELEVVLKYRDEYRARHPVR